MNDPGGPVTQLLAQISAGDPAAEDRLLRLVYVELKSVAAQRLRREQPGSTLTPTSLMHEAYVRVFRGNGVPLQNRKHLFFAFGQAMWRIVVEHHRRKRIQGAKVDPGLIAALAGLSRDDVLDLDDALDALRREHPREHEVAILRKAVGLSIPETARVLDASVATVKRRWAFAKAKLSQHLSKGEGNGHGSK